MEWTYVNDLEAFLEKLVGLIGEVVLDTALGSLVGLVDVNSTCWATELAGYVADVGGCTADCMVKDENARRSSATERS